MMNGRANVQLGRWCLGQIGWLFPAGTAMLAFATVVGIAAALLFQPLFDQGLIGRNGGILVSVIGLQLGLMLLRILLTSSALDLLARAGARLGELLTLRLYEHLQQHSLQYFLEKKQADLLQLLRADIALIEESLGQVSGWVVIGSFQAVGMLIVIGLWQPLMALVCLAGLVVGTILTAIAARQSNRGRIREIDANVAVTEHLLATLGVSGTLLRVGTAPRWPTRRMAAQLEAHRLSMLSRRLAPHWILSGAQATSAVTYCLFYLLGGYFVAGGTMSTGALVAMAAILGNLTAAVNQLAPMFVEFRDAWWRMRRIEQELATELPPPEIKPARTGTAIVGHYTLANVRVRSGRAVLLSRVTLDIRPGRITAISGRSGAGKTTLLLLLARLLEADDGQVLLDGQPLEQFTREDLWQNIGFMPQAAVLFRGSIKENICLGRAIPEQAMIDACVAAGLHDRIRCDPQGYDMEIGESGYRLSAGERQRLTFARAVVGSSKLLLLDEPTAHLDAAGEAIICRAIVDRRRQGCTVIAVTHSPAILALADEVIIVEAGLAKESARASDAVEQPPSCVGE
jgi:ABC-type bacteriocin/lantibiotic exporter with double-glycine peptidase domain